MIDEQRHSPWHYYVCVHGSSNTPCSAHFPPVQVPVLDADGNQQLDEHGRVVVVEQPQPTMPDNWMENYIPPGFSPCPACSNNNQKQGHTADAETCETCGGTGYLGGKLGRPLGISDAATIAVAPQKG